MVILGIATEHCSSASLMVDGAIVGAIQEERLTKTKNQVAFPKKSIEELVHCHLDGKYSRIKHVVFGGALSDPYATILDRHSNFTVQQHIQENHSFWRPFFYECDTEEDREKLAARYWHIQLSQNKSLNQNHNFDFSFLKDQPWKEAVDYYSRIARPERMQALFNWQGPSTLYDHHLCHAYYAYFGVNTEHHPEKDIVFTADGWGDNKNCTVYIPDEFGRELSELASGNLNIVGRLYRFTTLILGMKPNEHEYKVMGLAPYTKSANYIDEVVEIYLKILDFVDGAFVSKAPLKESYFDLKDRLEGCRFDNIAAGLQKWSEIVTGRWMTHWIRKTGRNRVFFSGGLSMNIKANGYLLNLGDMEALYVAPSGGDETLSMGACFAHCAKDGNPKNLTSAYIGPASGGHWSDRLSETRLTAKDFEVFEGVTDEAVAAILASGEIVARCVGPAEFGARALGARSILADPRDASVVKTINDAIKNRDFWMPFTPSIMDEYTGDYLIDDKSCVSEHMTIGFDSTALARKHLPAGLHPADYSVRPQRVKRDTNNSYWTLIDAFRQRTGVAALLNTSLNLHGEPMNYTAADAARTVALSALMLLQIDNGVLLVKRSEASRISNLLAH